MPCACRALQGVAEGQSQSLGDYVVLFLRLALGGCAVGIAVGIVVSIWLGYVYNDPILEVRPHPGLPPLPPMTTHHPRGEATPWPDPPMTHAPPL